MKNKESFAQSIYILHQYWDGYVSNPWGNDYFEGFAWAIKCWLSGAYNKGYYVGDKNFDAHSGFRQVVEEKKHADRWKNESEEFERGYDDALRIFREAKSL